MVQNTEKKYKIKKIFINLLLKKGKKEISEKKLKLLLTQIKKKEDTSPDKILIQSVQNLLPKIKAIPFTSKRSRKKKKRKNKNFNKNFLMFLNSDKQIKTSFLWLFKHSSKNLKKLDIEVIKTAKKKSASFFFKKKYYREIKKLKYNLKF
jgi:ribosomal protein S7